MLKVSRQAVGAGSSLAEKDSSQGAKARRLPAEPVESRMEPHILKETG